MGPTVGFRSQGAPHAHALQHALLWRLSCHCETPTLGCLCQQWPCALSLSVLFMGTREVARRVAGSGRAFLQHCSLYAALKQREGFCCWADSVCINYLDGVMYLSKLFKHIVIKYQRNIYSYVLNIIYKGHILHISLDAGPWSYSLPVVRTVNSCMESLPPPQGPAESSPHLLHLPLPRIHPQTAGASSPSTSPSSLGAKLLTWLPSAAPQMAMQACTHPCPHSARPPWTSTNCMCPALLQAKSQMRERTKRIRWRTPQCPNKVGQQQMIHNNYFDSLY